MSFWTSRGWHNPLEEWIDRNFMNTGDLRQLADVLTYIGKDPKMIGWEYLEESWWDPKINMHGDGVWPYFAERMELIQEGLGLRQQTLEKAFDRVYTLRILELFPAIPGDYVPALFDLAFGENKLPRPRAKTILNKVPGKEDRIVKALESGKQEVRTLAAEWLAELDHKPAVEPMKTALKKEKREVAKAALLSSMERLGEDLTPYIGPEVQLKEAERALKKGLPKGLSWFPVEALPVLHWSGGEAMNPEIIKWWLLVACQVKQPGGTPLLERYLDMLEKEDGQALGLFVFKAFIEHDTKGPTLEEANAYAEANIKQRFSSWKRWWDDLTEEHCFNMLKQEILGQYHGTAIKEKGVLALAVRAPGRDVGPMLQGFMRDHYIRRAQIEAMLETLATINDTPAIQQLLSVAQRYRTKSVQEKARELVETVAERNGWTRDQLADRTVPTAGLDERGEMELDCGTRTFTVRLDDDFKVVLTNPEGKTVKALPAPRKGEDPEPLKDAKKQLSDAKKELKQVMTLQKERLYEAMCVERRWPVSEWRQYLMEHPIVRRYCARLVWMAMQGETPLGGFRPLEDGSLTDAEDTDVTLPDGVEVMLAHSALLPAEDVAAWRTHLKDYEVKPLFPQVARDPMDLPDELKESTVISDRKGHMMDAFTLRGQATKLGYKRGDAEDAGFFYEYYKEFPGFGLTVGLEFTGNCLPEENVASALKDVRFGKQGRSRYSGTPMMLKDVPKVLLNEVWADYHTIAAAGTGFDPDWEKKAAW